MRVWIEICLYFKIRHIILVTLYVRVWIEIFSDGSGSRYVRVTLYVRVWIEIASVNATVAQRAGHPLREGVD